VANGGDSVTEFNRSSGALVRVIKDAAYDFNGPVSIAISGNDAFVANANGASVTEFNRSSGALVRVIR
jgi:N-methylhydantoinase A/oxoprolinase/acetone carboxylase beta subunit